MKNSGGDHYPFIRLFLLIISGFILIQCAKDEKIVPFTESEVIRLLSGDTTKSWLRISFKLNGADEDLNDCDLHTITTFYLDTSDSLKYTIVSNPVYCQSEADTLELGDWRIMGQEENQNIADRIELIFNGDTLQYQIDQVTSLYFNLSRSENDLLYQSGFEAILSD